MTKPRKHLTDAELEENSGPNLFVLYALVAAGILLAMAFAAMVIWPFYLRR